MIDEKPRSLPRFRPECPHHSGEVLIKNRLPPMNVNQFFDLITEVCMRLTRLCIHRIFLLVFDSKGDA